MLGGQEWDSGIPMGLRLHVGPRVPSELGVHAGPRVPCIAESAALLTVAENTEGLLIVKGPGGAGLWALNLRGGCARF